MALWKKNMSSFGIYNESYNLPLENNYHALVCVALFDISIGLIRGRHEGTNLVPIKSSILSSVQFIDLQNQAHLTFLPLVFKISRSWLIFSRSMFSTNLQSFAWNMCCEVFHCSGFPKKNRWIEQFLNFKLHDFCQYLTFWMRDRS